MAKGSNIVMKDFLPLMAKLHNEIVATKAYPFLNMPPDWNFGLGVKLPKGTWDMIM